MFNGELLSMGKDTGDGMACATLPTTAPVVLEIEVTDPVTS